MLIKWSKCKEIVKNMCKNFSIVNKICISENKWIRMQKTVEKKIL